MIRFDFWYGHTREDVNSITVNFYPNYGEYRGWLRHGTQIIGDFVADDSVELEREFLKREENNMDRKLKDMYMAMETLEAVYPQVSEIETPEAFQAFIGTLVDTWGAEHGMDSEEVCEMLDMLATVQKQVHAEFGGM